MTDTTDLVDAQVAAFADRDLDRFLTFHAPDVKIRAFDGTVLMDGAESMREQYGQLFSDSPNLKIAITRRIAVGEFAVDEAEDRRFHASNAGQRHGANGCGNKVKTTLKTRGANTSIAATLCGLCRYPLLADMKQRFVN
jgi:hypothetical protein